VAPSYLKLFHKGILHERVEEALHKLESCCLCPRKCGVNRLNDETGFCKTGRRARVASYNAHFGEESPLVGNNGSGTIFLSSCNLLCGFCQNFEISHLNEGNEVEPEQMALMMIRLAENGCHNINFVTPSHVVPQILEALLIAVNMGLSIPLLYNSSGYDEKETLGLLDGVFDIFMPDFKFWNAKWSRKYCDVEDYKDVAILALKEMHRQVGDLKIDEQGVAIKGLLIRHLVMPGMIEDSRNILNFIANDISKDSYVNVMDQYRPSGRAFKDEMINRRLNASEFKEAIDYAEKAGLNRLDPREKIRFMLNM